MRTRRSGVCDDTGIVAPLDDLGIFRLTSTDEQPIEAGELRLEIRAIQSITRIVNVTIGPGENVDVGDIRLAQAAVLTDQLRSCRVPAEGGRCDYSIRVANNQARPLVGTYFSRVDVIASAEPLEYLTRFEAGALPSDPNIQRTRVAIPSLETQVIGFSFDVPAAVPNGTEICVYTLLGLDPAGVLRSVSRGFNFCFRKGSNASVPTRPIAVLERRDFVIDSPSIAFENLTLCPTVPLAGGTCEYSVDVVNREATPFVGTARSAAEAAGVLGLPTFFEVDGRDGTADVARPLVDLPPFGRTTLTFKLDVLDAPPSRLYTPICTRLYLGADPAPLFMPVREEPLFCLVRTETGFEAVDDRVLP